MLYVDYTIWFLPNKIFVMRLQANCDKKFLQSQVQQIRIYRIIQLMGESRTGFMNVLIGY
jgi:hypothetical protein